MTMTAERTTVVDVPRPAGSRGEGWLYRWTTIVAAAAAGILIIGFSYRLSAQAAAPNVYYIVFWTGMICASLPVCAKLAAPAVSTAARMWAIVLFGFITAVPKYLRNPGEPRYHDEYAHWREAVDVMLAGQLFRPNTIIPIVEFFPGTSALTAVSGSFTGLNTWSSGLLVILAMHVLGLFAVYVLAETHLSSPRAGGIAAVVYGLNPSAVYFDTQYAYESIAINLFLWVLALTSLAAQRYSPRRRLAFLVLAVLCAAGAVVTHHLTTVFLIVALTTVAVTSTFRFWKSRRSRRDSSAEIGAMATSTWWIMLVCTVLLAAIWVLLFARPTLDYLSPYFGSSVDQLGSIAQQRGDGGRQLLAANVQPLWERLFTAAAPGALSLVAVAAALMLRQKRVRIDATTLGVMVFGLGYFISIPFLLAPSGAEGARRAWGFTYVGIALIVAMVVDHWPQNWPRWSRRDGRPTLLVGLFVTLLIGNVAGGLNDPYRFPGPFRWGTDTNSASDEARTVAQQLEAVVGRVRVVSDAYTSLQLAAYGGFGMAAPSIGFPAWELTQTDADPSAELAGMLIYSEYYYLVVDTRMAEETPFNGHNFGQHDPLLGQATPRENLARLDSVPWATRVITTPHLRVYRLNLSDIVTGGRGLP